MTIIDDIRHAPYTRRMASLNISMPDDMRQFVDQRTREGGFSTPTEYLRSLIRDDRRRLQGEQFGPLILKWLSEGRLTLDEETSLPPGLLERVQQRLETQLLEAVESGDAGELNRERLEAILNRARAKVAAQTSHLR